jgi:hypothetical protein
LQLVTEASESPGKTRKSPLDRAQTGHIEAIELIADGALAYFVGPTPELFEVCPLRLLSPD